MAVTLTDLREIHGSVFVTEVPDGLIVPWKPLSIKDFYEYEVLLKSNYVDHSVLENEIFVKCVKDPVLVRNIHSQKAGTISIVVKSIMENSGPKSIEEFNQTLDYYRTVVQQPISQFVSIICRAFPAYTPDDIFAMDYHLMLERLALAESKLMQLGLLAEPLAILDENEEEKEEVKQPKQKLDAKQIKEAFDSQEQKPPKKINRQAKEIEHIDREQPVDMDKNGKTIIGVDSLRSRFASGNDIEDLPLLEHELQKGAEAIFGDYLKQGNKVKIKTVEERIAEANKRMARNKARLKKK